MSLLQKTPMALSCIFPGIGQIYNREHLSGAVLILLEIALLSVVLTVSNEILSLICTVVAPIVWVYSVVDASQIYRHPLVLWGKRSRYRIITICVIGVGILVEVGFSSFMWTWRGSDPLPRHSSTIAHKPDKPIRPNVLAASVESHQSNQADVLSENETIVVEEPQVITKTVPVDTKIASGVSYVSAMAIDNRQSDPIDVASDIETKSTEESENISHQSLDKARFTEVSLPLPTADESSAVVSRSRYAVVVATVYTMDQAQKLTRRLSASDRTLEIKPKTTPRQRQVYVVRIAGLTSRQEAKTAQQKLRADFPKEFKDCYIYALAP